MVNIFSEFSWVVPIHNKNLKLLLMQLAWFALHAKPNSHQSDNDSYSIDINL